MEVGRAGKKALADKGGRSTMILTATLVSSTSAYSILYHDNGEKGACEDKRRATEKNK